MDFQNYDDYMRNTLGFSGMGAQSMGCMNCGNMSANSFQGMGNNQMWQAPSCDLEAMYPDSYRVIYPMVVSVCNTVTMPVTEDMIDRITDDIYDRAVSDVRISVDINVEVESREDGEDRQMMNRPRRPRPRRNRFLRDFIRVLLLRELLGRQRRFPIF